jgi:hypothetical protein
MVHAIEELLAGLAIILRPTRIPIADHDDPSPTNTISSEKMRSLTMTFPETAASSTRCGVTELLSGGQLRTSMNAEAVSLVRQGSIPVA